MGLGTLYPPQIVLGTNAESRPDIPDLVPFGRSSPPKRETSVSCLMVTTVLTRVHCMFPIPFTLATFLLLARRIGTGLHQSYVLAHRSFNRSFAPPDYSRRTCSQGHAVPSVVLVKNKTQRALPLLLIPALQNKVRNDAKSLVLDNKSPAFWAFFFFQLGVYASRRAE
jgi:hypothetical protein